MADISKITAGSTTYDIKDAVARQQIAALPTPMQFKGSLGTGGTITSLPTASASNKGYTYKVITAGTYASIAAKVGDTFISDGSAWVLIPSGDEPSGTVTSITLKATSPIAIDSASAITTSGTRTFSHAAGSAASKSSGLYKFSTDATSHISGVTAVAKSDITALGIPAQDTTYSAGTNISISGTTISATDTKYGIATYNTNGLIKPWKSYTAASTGPTAVTASTAVAVNAISSTAGKYYAVEMDNAGRAFVNVPWINTTYSVATQSANGLMSSGDKTKLDGIATGATNVTTSTVSGWGYTKNTGTVTSITVKANAPLAIDSSSAITTSGTRTLSHVTSGAEAGTYGDENDQTPAYGATFKALSATVDTYGHITDISEHSVKIPAVPRIDQVTANTTANYVVIDCGSSTVLV